MASGRSLLSRMVLAGVTSAAFAAPALALDQASGPSTTQPSPEQMAEEIRLLKARLEQLEGQVKQQPTTMPVEPAEVTVDRVMRDAAKRSQVLDVQGFTAGYDQKRFVIRSEDGNFVFRPWLHLQFRYVVNWRENNRLGQTVDDTQSGFELRRARFGFDGNMFSPDFTYFFNWATYRGSGTSTVTNAGVAVGTVNNGLGGLPVLEEAWAKYHFPNTPFYIKGGQMHDPLSHEAIVGSKYEVTPERSLQNDIFANTDTFTQGVSFIWDPKTSIRTEVAATDGIRAANTNFQDYPNNFINYDYGFAGRVEFKVFGNWKDYDQFTSLGNSKDLLVFGAGADYSETGDTYSLTHALDVQYAMKNGLFVYGSYIGRYISNTLGIPSGGPVSTTFITPANPGADTYEPSFLGHVGYLIAQKWEPYARYEYLYLQGTPAGSVNGVQEISLGVTYWWFGHNAKITTQVMYLPQGIPISDDSSDVLANNGNNELIFTTQFQLLL